MKKIWFNRYYENKLNTFIEKGKVFILYGPRRVGKTELIKKHLSNSESKIFQGTGDDMLVREILSSQQKGKILSNFDGYDIIFIDEAQRIPEIGWGLKILVDHLPETKIIVTGSSSFSLSGKIGEPLTGRNKIVTLFPLSILELSNQLGGMEIQQKLEELLIYGAYPDILKMTSKEKKN
jgi:predicted AAA+ superfamily ATPase